MPDGFSRPERQPLYNLMAEEALLGALLDNNKTYDTVSDYLQSGHFYSEVHQRIYKAIGQRCESGRVADVVTLRGEFDRETAEYLMALPACMISHDIGAYGRQVFDFYRRRRLVEVGGDVSKRAPSIEIDVEKQIEAAEQALFGLTDGAGEMKPFSLLETMRLAIEEGDNNRKGTASFISTGLRSLDEKILGLRAGWLDVFAGRPGSGKTTLARSIALNVGCGGYIETSGSFVMDRDAAPVLYCSLEEEPPDFGAALVSLLANVPVATVLMGDGTPDQIRRIGDAYKFMERVRPPIECIPKHGQSLRQITAAGRRFKRKHGAIGLLVVDYLQMMADPPGQKEKRLAVGENIYGLKNLAKELKCPVIALSQLSREVEKRADKRPTMADLRETGQIEDAADVVGLLYREAYYLAQDEPKRADDDLDSDAKRAEWAHKLSYAERRAEMILGKVRKARTGVVHLGFNGAASRFEDLVS